MPLWIWIVGGWMLIGGGQFAYYWWWHEDTLLACIDDFGSTKDGISIWAPFFAALLWPIVLIVAICHSLGHLNEDYGLFHFPARSDWERRRREAAERRARPSEVVPDPNPKKRIR